ncbi:MAG: DUF6364 family protein [Bacteroidota bacterium]
MDTKVTLNFDQEVIEKAKKFAAAQNISLSRLTEFLYKKIISQSYQNLEDMPISDWVMQVAEGKAEYKRKRKNNLKQEFYERKK